ncbi:hypothetical protein [Enterococcus rotai]|uniref:hypothetical protein n=1 Tax=Enterococcus rotai TaxID=118060 RepID=UPI0035C678CA
MNEEHKKIINTARQIDEAQKALLVPLVVKHYRDFIKTDEYQEILNDKELTDDGENMLIVLSIYDRVQNEITNNEIKKILSSGDTNIISEKIIDLYKTVHDLETELYMLQIIESDEQEEPFFDCMNSYYGCLPEEKIGLFEVIEEVVKQRKDD